MKNVYSVGQVNNYIKNMFTQDFMLSRIYVKGEVSNCKYHTSGHIYFSLKDETGTISCVMFAGARKGLAFRMQDGQKAVVLGSVNVYERDGRYQLYAREIILEGAGLLYERYEALKKELEEMGMFSSQFKQEIPSFINRLGIVTAPTGAAVRDIMNIARRRDPYVQLVLYPALVQGEGAADSIVKGIEVLDGWGVDTIIVGRGGGSIEDLWAFNEEKVARAIFNCSTPVISAVGHETDVTIADYVADLRAPTPSAAAELAVADVLQLAGRLSQYRFTLQERMAGQIERARQKAENRQVKLGYLSPENQIREKRQNLIDREVRLQQLIKKVLDEKRHQMMIYVERMRGLSPLDKLSQGYSYISDEEGRTVTSIGQAHSGQNLKLYVTDGFIRAQVAGKEKMKWQKKKI